MKSFMFVVGGTSGLGLDIARIADAEGYGTAVLGRAAKNLPSGTAFVKADLDDWDTAFRAVNDMRRWLDGPMTHLVLAAGSWLQGPTYAQTYAQMRQQLDIALHQFLVARMEATHRKTPLTIITVGSTTVFTRREYETAYRAGKVALRTFMVEYHTELTQRLPGSRQLIVHPGGMKDTNFYINSNVDTSPVIDPALVSRLTWDTMESLEPNELREIKIPRPLTPEEPPRIEPVKAP